MHVTNRITRDARATPPVQAPLRRTGPALPHLDTTAVTCSNSLAGLYGCADRQRETVARKSGCWPWSSNNGKSGCHAFEAPPGQELAPRRGQGLESMPSGRACFRGPPLPTAERVAGEGPRKHGTQPLPDHARRKRTPLATPTRLPCYSLDKGNLFTHDPSHARVRLPPGKAQLPLPHGIMPPGQPRVVHDRRSFLRVGPLHRHVLEGAAAASFVADRAQFASSCPGCQSGSVGLRRSPLPKAASGPTRPVGPGRGSSPSG